MSLYVLVAYFSILYAVGKLISSARHPLSVLRYMLKKADKANL